MILIVATLKDGGMEEMEEMERWREDGVEGWRDRGMEGWR